MLPIRETLTQAGYVSAEPLGDGEFALIDEDGNRELWFVNPHHANYGIVLEVGSELEFARSI